jgi:hypothetical protein
MTKRERVISDPTFHLRKREKSLPIRRFSVDSNNDVSEYFGRRTSSAPRLTYSDESTESEESPRRSEVAETVCAICHDVVEKNDSVILTACHHEFHRACVEQQHNSVCALCRAPIINSDLPVEEMVKRKKADALARIEQDTRGALDDISARLRVQLRSRTAKIEIGSADWVIAVRCVADR